MFKPAYQTRKGNYGNPKENIQPERSRPAYRSPDWTCQPRTESRKEEKQSDDERRGDDLLTEVEHGWNESKDKHPEEDIHPIEWLNQDQLAEIIETKQVP